VFSRPVNIDIDYAPRSAPGLLKVGDVATWLEHPRYVAVREHLIVYLSSTLYRFRRLERVLFFCGGAGSPRRDALRDYFRRHAPWLSIFYAEVVWEQIAARSDQGALKMEADLAALADLVLVIVESPGTFAELGAFSISEPLRKKLLPIIDTEYSVKPSFIATGPLRWINAESLFAPAIDVPLSRILQVVDQVEDRIARIPRIPAVKISDLATSPKHLLFFLCDLIAVICPATPEMVEYYLGRIAPSLAKSDINVPTLIGLAVAMGLLRAEVATAGDRGETFLWPTSPRAIEHPFHHASVGLPSQRAEHVSVLLTIPQAKDLFHDRRKTP
jgi:hypothetical protein